jgi:mannose-6-phosphate isomerase-like protein (cupin superfamily)
MTNTKSSNQSSEEGEPATGWENKVWGRTRIDYLSGMEMGHSLEVVEGHVCSMHIHENRDNTFVVDSGVIRVVYIKGMQVFSKTIGDGCEKNRLFIPPWQVHQFQVLSSGKLREYYTSYRKNLDPNDIVRFSTGCAVPIERLRNNVCFWDSHGGIVETWDLTNVRG